MKRTLLASLFAFGLPMLTTAARADEPTVAVAAADPPPSRVRLVGVILSSAQALLWDDEHGEYVLHKVGEELLGGRIVELEADHLVVDRGETREVVEIAAPPQTRVAGRRPRRMPAMIVSAAPDVPTAVATAQAAVDKIAAAQAAVAPAAAPAAVAVPSATAAPAVPAPAMVAPVAAPSVAAVAVAAPAPAVAAPPDVAAPAVVVAPAAVAAPAVVAPAAVATAAAPNAAAAPTVVAAPLAAPAPAPAPAAAPSALPAPAPAPVAAPTAAVAPTATAAPTSGGPLVLARAELDRELGDFGSLSQQLQVAAQPEGGFRLAQVRGGSFFERIGLRTNDVVLRVDGRPINGVDDASAAYAWLRVASQFTVEVLRDGRPVTLRYVIAGGNG